MKKVLFVTTYTTFPPKGWGACEIITYELSCALKKRGIQTEIVASKTFELVIEAINTFQPDIVHFEYDDYSIGSVFVKQKFPGLRCAATTHFAYLHSPKLLAKETYYVDLTLKNTLDAMRQGLELYPGSEAIIKTYKHFGGQDIPIGSPLPNGANTCIRFTENPLNPGKGICLGKLEPRKGQARLRFQKNIDIIGPLDNSEDFDTYRGEWTRDEVHDKLTDYGILVLLSYAEAASLVVLEGLMAGLGLVLTEEASSNLDIRYPWIRVLTQEEANDPIIVARAISETLVEVSEPGVRKQIRAYAEKNHSWDVIAERYERIVLHKLSERETLGTSR